MKRLLACCAVSLAWTGLASASGLLIPVEKSIPPLAMLQHHVVVNVEDQAAVTKVTQTFRNHTSRPLEATYVFPVPRNASVRSFVMWVDGKPVKGELIPAKEAHRIYTDIVRQSQDPGLLEYVGTDLLSLRVFPVPPHGDQKVEVSFTAIAKKDHNVVEYVYPLKTDGKATATLEDFSLTLNLKSQNPIVNPYSPTHAVAIDRKSDREAVVKFEKHQAVLDKSFQLFYVTSDKDVGLTTLQHRPITTEDGYALLLISPRAELAKTQQVPRDVVFVLDTSGSMLQDGKMEQAKKALKFCLSALTEKDRFGIVQFATTVNRYKENLVAVNAEQMEAAKKWIDDLSATGGTAIQAAMASALEMRVDDPGRTFNVVFFTDGKPTIGETNTDKILANVAAKNTANTRIFTFGLGHDLNAAFLDQMAEQSRAASSYVRPEEDIEIKVSSFFGKISRPVLANLKLHASGGSRLVEVFPPQLPDLFHGDQLVVLARYQGSGPATLTLSGTVGMEAREFVYETEFLARSAEKPFVEDLWARRKVGYLLDQIRINGEKKELVDEATALAKKYGITTPYTSYLIVPDAPIPVAGARPGAAIVPQPAPPPAVLRVDGTKRRSVAEFAQEAQRKEGELAQNRNALQDRDFAKLPPAGPGAAGGGRGAAEDFFLKRQLESKALKEANDLARANLAQGRWKDNQINKLGVDLAECTNALKCQDRLQASAVRQVNNRNCMEIGGVWIDEKYVATTPTINVKAMSDAYFRILEKHPEMKDVFRLGNYLVWIAPSGTALVIDLDNGKEKLTDEEIDALFVAMK